MKSLQSYAIPIIESSISQPAGDGKETADSGSNVENNPENKNTKLPPYKNGNEKP